MFGWIKPIYNWMRFQYGIWWINKHSPDDDVCCCGDSMTNHNYDGNYHYPISQKDYAIHLLHSRIYGK